MKRKQQAAQLPFEMVLPSGCFASPALSGGSSPQNPQTDPVPPASAAAPSPGSDRIREYVGPGAQAWRCSRYDLATAEMGCELNLAEFHAAVEGDARRWLIARRLFGMGPLLPPQGTDPDDLRVWSREELAATLALTAGQLRQELDAIRGLATRAKSDEVRAEKIELLREIEELTFKETVFLAKHGFEESTFLLTGREAVENRTERDWFGARVEQWDKLLEHPVAGALARQALLNELQLRRADAAIAKLPFGGKEYSGYLKIKMSIEETYQHQLEQLDELAPWAGAIRGHMAFRGMASDLIQAIANSKRGDEALVDGIFTTVELQILTRRSLQAPEPQYRAGLVVYLNAAKAGLWNPDWRSQFTNGQLKKLDTAWAAAAAAAGDLAGERLVDLEADGPAGEYDPLFVKSDDRSADHGKSPMEADGPA